MSKNVTIAIYSNLPFGGGLTTQISTEHYLAEKGFKIFKILESKYKIRNFLAYLYISIIVSPRLQRDLIRNTPHHLLIAYHSWLTKAPSVLRYSNGNKIYICHESMREYYDIEHIRYQSIKERIVNLLRLPIKWLDRYNIQSPNTTIVANSYFSKRIIDNAYSVNSVVVYPGIDVKKYLGESSIKKANQVICISAINKYKRQDFLVDILANMSEENRPLLVLIGNGFDEKYLLNLYSKAKSLNVKLKVKINISEKEKVKELKKSKIFIYAPISEPFGIVVEEAVASGLPILVYKYGGGYVELVSKNNGIIMNNLDPKLWSDRLSQLLKNVDKLKYYSEYNRKYAIDKLDSKYMNETLLTIVKSNL